MKSSRELKAGIFVILTLAATFLAVNYLRGNGLFRRGKTLFTTYGNVQGLNPATPVYINGFKAGSVSDIKYDKSIDAFTIKLTMTADFDIPVDSRTEIFSSDILGGKSIRIVPGTSQELVSSSDTLEGAVCEDPLSSVMAGLPSMMDKIDSLVCGVTAAVGSINKILDDGGRADLSAMIGSLRRSAESIETLTAGIREKSPQMEDFIANLDELSATLKGSAAKLDTVLVNAQDITLGLKNADMYGTVRDLDSLVRKLQDPEGSIGRMMTTDTLHESINSLVRDLDSLVNKIKENPRKALKISVF